MRLSAIRASAVALSLVSVCSAQRTVVLPPAGVNARPDSSSPPGLIAQYCVGCHNDRLRTAGLTLSKVTLADAGKAAGIWEKVVRRIRAGEMPPVGAAKPSPETIYAFATEVEAVLDRAFEANPQPGRVPLHRMNRAEYSNAIRDLLAVEMKLSNLLPPDDVDEQGFENIAGNLSVSPVLLEGYVEAADRISRLALGMVTSNAVFEVTSLPKNQNQDDRISDDLPFGSRGGTAIRFRFPADGDYSAKVTLRRQLYDYLVGVGRAQTIQVRLDGTLVGTLRFGGGDYGTPSPATWVGAIPGDEKWEKHLTTADKDLEVRFAARAGMHTLGVAFIKEQFEQEGVLLSRNSPFGLSSDEQFLGNAAVDTVVIKGPYNAQGAGDLESRARIFVCYPKTAAAENPCARKILTTLARRAFRRVVHDNDIESVFRFYAAGKKQGGFEEGIRFAVQSLLSDPEFIFRAERTPPNAQPGAPYPIWDPLESTCRHASLSIL